MRDLLRKSSARRSLFALFALVSAVAFATAGCAHCPLCGGEWGAASAAAAQAAPPRLVDVSGTVSCPDRLAVLPVYELRVRLRDAAGGRVVAESSLSPIGSFPAFFSLQYDAAGTKEGEPLLLSSELLSGDAPIMRTDCDTCLKAGETARGLDLVLSRPFHPSAENTRK